MQEWSSRGHGFEPRSPNGEEKKLTVPKLSRSQKIYIHLTPKLYALKQAVSRTSATILINSKVGLSACKSASKKINDKNYLALFTLSCL